LQTKNAVTPLTWKNTLQEHIKQSTEREHSNRRKEDHLLEMRIFMGIKSKSNKLSFNKFNYTKDSLILIHQNISKIDELKCSVVRNNINPHFICLSEHYMSDQKLSYSNFQNYVLGTKYARTIHQGGHLVGNLRTL
jgi:hypothetical protein